MPQAKYDSKMGFAVSETMHGVSFILGHTQTHTKPTAHFILLISHTTLCLLVLIICAYLFISVVIH